MRTRTDHRSATDESPMANVKKLAAITGVITACAAALGGACGDPTSNTTGAGGAGLSASSSSGGGVGGVGGEDLSVVAGSVTVGSGSSSSSSGLPPPKCGMPDATAGLTKFANAYGDANVQTGSAVTFDKSGNILVAGSFGGSINLGTTTLNSAGTDDVFVAKFSPLGQLMWAKSFGDAGLQTATGIGVDANGNVYVTGNFKGSINFGGGALNAAGTLFVDVFLAKLTSDGNHVWSQKFGDENVQSVRGLSVDTAGNLVIAGYFQNDVNFGGAVLTSAGGLDDVFVAKFNTGGAHQWSRRFGDATAHQRARAVALDAAGSVYLTGEASGSIDFGGGAMTAPSDPSAYVAKLDSLGNVTWAKLSTGDATNAANGKAIAVGPTGEVAVGGSFKGKFDLGGMPAMNPGSDNAFVTLLSAAGAHTYTKTFGDTESQTVTGLAIATNGEVIAAGNYSGSIDFETGVVLTSAGQFDGFLARLNSKGCPAWLHTYAGLAGHSTQALALDPTTGGVALTGSFSGSADFGIGTIPSVGDDVFLMSVNP